MLFTENASGNNQCRRPAFISGAVMRHDDQMGMDLVQDGLVCTMYCWSFNWSAVWQCHLHQALSTNETGS